jgi:hypothetical protein
MLEAGPFYLLGDALPIIADTGCTTASSFDPLEKETLFRLLSLQAYILDPSSTCTEFRISVPAASFGVRAHKRPTGSSLEKAPAKR